jgi:hypothetical protein
MEDDVVYFDIISALSSKVRKKSHILIYQNVAPEQIWAWWVYPPQLEYNCSLSELRLHTMMPCRPDKFLLPSLVLTQIFHLDGGYGPVNGAVEE